MADTDNDTFTRLAEILNSWPGGQISENATLAAIGIKPAKYIRHLQTAIERAFGIEFAPGTILSADLTVGDLVKIIDELRDE